MNRPIKRSLSLLAAVAACVFASAALAQSDATATKFLTDAIRGNLAEIKMGELAQQRGKSAAVREYGKMLVEDHTKGLQKTTALAKKLGVTPPTETSAGAMKMHEALSKLSGEQFDAEFASEMVEDHRKDIGEYTEQTRDGGNPAIAELATDTLPTLREHLAKAQALQQNEQSANAGAR